MQHGVSPREPGRGAGRRYRDGGRVMAGGATMTGTVSDGTEVEVIGEAEFLGQKYFQIRESSKEGWVDGRFLELR